MTTCAALNCETILSRYNSTEYCSVHSVPSIRIGPTQRRKIELTLAFEDLSPGEVHEKDWKVKLRPDEVLLAVDACPDFTKRYALVHGTEIHAGKNLIKRIRNRGWLTPSNLDAITLALGMHPEMFRQVMV